VAVVAAAVLVGGAGSPVHAQAVDPVGANGAYSPRVVVIDGEHSEVRLVDDLGTVIPLTAPGAERRDGTTRVNLPRLPEGRYRIEHPGGAEEILVGEPATATTGDAAGTRPLTGVTGIALLSVAVLVAALAAALAYRGRRRVAGAVLLLGGVGVVSLLLLPDPSEADPCAGIAMHDEQQQCFREHLSTVLERDGLAAAVARLEDLVAVNGSPWALTCHETAHYLGEIGWRTVAGVKDVVDAGTVDCSFGFFHGALESMGTYGTDEHFPQSIREMCSLLEERFSLAGDANTPASGECYHGAGHAAMWRYGQRLSAAASACDVFRVTGGDTWRREECLGGAVMEWVYARERAEKFGTADDLPEPRVTNTMELCAPPYGELSAGCVEGALTGTTYTAFPAAVSWCRTNPDFAETCALVLARKMMFWITGGQTDALPALVELCDNFAGTSAARRCPANVGYMHLFLIRDYPAAKAVCDAFDADRAATCREGIREVYRYAARIGDKSYGPEPDDL